MENLVKSTTGYSAYKEYEEMSAFSLRLNGTQLAFLKVPKKKAFGKTHHHRLFPEILTWLLRIIHRPCCEHFGKKENSSWMKQLTTKSVDYLE